VGEGDHPKDGGGGGSKPGVWGRPSTPLRAVPLPRVATLVGEDQAFSS